MVVHTNHLASYVGFTVAKAHDGYYLVFRQKVRVDLLTNLERQLLKVAGVRHGASRELIGHSCGLQAVSFDVFLVKLIVRLSGAVLQ